MSADTQDLAKVDSAVGGVDAKGATKPDQPRKERKSSSAPGVMNIADLERDGVEIQIAKETQKLNWKLNSSPNSIDEPAVLKKMLTTPPVKKIDLHFPLGLEVTARNLKGVTIKDALDAIHKQFKKKADDELELPVLAGFEWDKEISWTKLIVHQKKEGAAPSSKKSKKNKGEDD